MDLLEAANRYRRSMSHCENLATVHRAYGGPNQGRRDEEVSLNRAIVVMTVAAWQSAVQDLALAAVDAAAPGPNSPMSAQTYALLRGRVLKEISDFSTPNAENSRRLLQGTGFDPRPSWTWSQHGGQGVGMIQLQPHDVEERMRQWLRLRHDIAHGEANMSTVAVLQAVRARGANVPAGWSPTIRLVDAEACMAFFRRVSRLAAFSLAAHLGIAAGAW